MSIVKPTGAGEPASNVSYDRLSHHKLKSSATALSGRPSGRRHSGIVFSDKMKMKICDKGWQRRA